MGQNKESRNNNTNNPTWFLTKVQKNFSGENITFSIIGAGAIEYRSATKTKINLNLNLTPFTKFNLKGILDLNMKAKSI